MSFKIGDRIRVVNVHTTAPEEDEKINGQVGTLRVVDGVFYPYEADLDSGLYDDIGGAFLLESEMEPYDG